MAERKTTDTMNDDSSDSDSLDCESPRSSLQALANLALFALELEDRVLLKYGVHYSSSSSF